ncbi:hypothetical protein FB45DRAFT_876513 [Roridomyces roridus]|uniref:Uncharacterized protein n=1 Tax=Roridomyces roridus TaxID=1738132 RepID=A0AAD7B342_9AGAR|nr:hypothetical protein FB45DRAFT_876513 [Roridomyces roridus]
MPSTAVIKILILVLCTFLVLQAQSLYHLSAWTEVQGFGLSVALSRILASYINAPITIGQPFVPSLENIIFEPPSSLGHHGSLGWAFPGSANEIGRNFFDGFSRNITIMVTPPGGAEQFLVGMASGPAHGFCGFTPGSASRGLLNSFIAGNYTARWIVEFGQSSQPDAHVDRRTGCGPEPFNLTTVEFARSWQVVPMPAS